MLLLIEQCLNGLQFGLLLFLLAAGYFFYAQAGWRPLLLLFCSSAIMINSAKNVAAAYFVILVSGLPAPAPNRASAAPAPSWAGNR